MNDRKLAELGTCSSKTAQILSIDVIQLNFFIVKDGKMFELCFKIIKNKPLNLFCKKSSISCVAGQDLAEFLYEVQ